MKFTDRQIQALKPQAKRYDQWEGNGLGIRVSPQGRKSWVMVYRFDGRPRYVTLGVYPRMTVAHAHEAHGKALVAVATGIDPGARQLEAKQAERAAPTVTRLVEDYLHHHVRPNLRSAREYQRILEKEVLPLWGALKAKDVTRRDVIALLDGVKVRGGTQANQTLAVVRALFNFGVDRAVLEVSPCLRVKAPAPKQARDRVLSRDELRALWQATDLDAPMTLSWQVRAVLRLMLLTGQRKGECLTARWEHIDWVAGTWTIPATTAKNGRAHVVPLTPLAVQLLKRIKDRAEGSPWMFPSPRNPSAPVGTTACDHALHRLLPQLGLAGFTPHDCRRTVASGLASLKIPRLVVSKVLNHCDGSVTGVYDRHPYLPEMREALERWTDHLAGVVTSSQNAHA